ncbi:hypothetical protein KI440_02440 [Candidatus Saccharibacteria bacterium TM7i]|nr:hypothetical protein KI440_02440 [Candidatus Saccharibacteria bacterium TM7i]
MRTVRNNTRKSPPRSRRERFVSGFGATGYFFAVIQWLMAFALYFVWIYTYFLVPMQPTATPNTPAPTPAPAVPSFEAPSPFVTVLLALFALAMIGVTIYALIVFPRLVSRAGSKAATVVAKQAAPLVLKAQHLPETKKNTLKISGRIIIVLKVLMVAVPLGLAWASQFIGEQVLSLDMALLAAAVLAVPTAFFFVAQYVCAWAMKVPLEKVR